MTLATFPRRIATGSLAATLLLAASAEAQYLYTHNNASGVKDWSTPAYWASTTPPPSVATDLVQITSISTSQNIRFTANQTMLGGFTQSHRATLYFDLNGNTATIADTWLLGVTTTDHLQDGVHSRFSNGMLQLGTEVKAATINAFTGSVSAPAGGRSLQVTGTLNSLNLAEIGIIKNPGSAHRDQNGTIDLSGAKLLSGAQENALNVTGGVMISLIDVTTNAARTSIGALLLPSTIEHLSMGSLLVGKNTSLGNATGYYTVSGTLHLGGGAATSMNVAGDFVLGEGDNATGTVIGQPTALHLTVGSVGEEGAIRIGTKTVGQTSNPTPDRHTSGSLIANGGTLNAHLSELRIGQNTRPGGSASGVLDYHAGTLGELRVSGAAIIGAGEGATGRLLLHGGEASAASLVVGHATGTPSARSLLELDETSFTTASLTLGDWGDLRITTGVGGGFLDITGSTFSILGDGLLEINFSTAAEDDLLWGLRMAGDQRSLFGQYLEDGLLAATGLYGEQAAIHFDGTHTFYGIPEPSSFLLAGAGLGAATLLRRRKKMS